MNNTGFLEPKITLDHWILGSSTLPNQPIQQNGDWTAFLPEFESQIKRIETFNCTGFNTEKPIRILLKKLGIDENYSARWIGIIAGTTPPGNDPHTVAEAIRKNGLIPESMLPFSDDLNTSEYFSFKGADEATCRAEGKRWLERFQFGHEWVPSNPSAMLEALKLSPLGVAVNAWNRDQNGLYINQTDNFNHWTCCVVGYEQDKYWLIDDSYLQDGTPLKKLAWNYKFGYCKRYSIVIKNVEKETITLMERLVKLLKQYLAEYLK